MGAGPRLPGQQNNAVGCRQDEAGGEAYRGGQGTAVGAGLERAVFPWSGLQETLPLAIGKPGWGGVPRGS